MNTIEIYSGISPYGNYKKTWALEGLTDDESDFSLNYQEKRLRSLVWYSFFPSVISDEIQSSWNPEKCTFNIFTIERSLRSLQNHLGFEFPHPQEVVEYLLQYPGLYHTVINTCFNTKKVFGHNSQISLEVYHDPEIDDEYLTIFIRQEEYEPDIIEKIDAICREYERFLVNESGYLLVNTDFRPPMV